MLLFKKMTAGAKPQLPLATVVGMLLLMWSASVYSGFGLSAYPRQEWLIELLVAIVMLIPVVNLLVTPGSLSSAVRFVGLALIAHSFWDALHWPGLTLIHTPIDPRITRICPIMDLPMGFWLLVRGR